jgi:aspartyl-tRNA(Asn)/glutamyl-tRNA(Gln) amidotransferase subunit B
MVELLMLVKNGDISNNTAKTTVFNAMYETGESPQTIIEREGLKQVSDTGAIDTLIDQVLKAHPGPVQDFKEGKQKALGFLVGQIMKASKGQANPQMVNDLLRKKLS